MHKMAHKNPSEEHKRKRHECTDLGPLYRTAPHRIIVGLVCIPNKIEINKCECVSVCGSVKSVFQTDRHSTANTLIHMFKLKLQMNQVDLKLST